MNFKNLTEKIPQVLERVCDEYSVTGEPGPRGGSWTFVLDGSITGFIGCEDNKEDIDIPTVTIALAVAEMATYQPEDLVRLLETNGHFFEVGFTAIKLDGDEDHTLFLQRRIPAELYEARDFREHVDFMLKQLRLFIDI
jgi:hypothetical protein